MSIYEKREPHIYHDPNEENILRRAMKTKIKLMVRKCVQLFHCRNEAKKHHSLHYLANITNKEDAPKVVRRRWALPKFQNWGDVNHQQNRREERSTQILLYILRRKEDPVA